MEAFIKIALLVGLVVLTLGVIPDRRIGAIIAIGTCVMGALALHSSRGETRHPQASFIEG